MNTTTTESKKFRRGDLRSDGKIFWAYKENGYERWISPERFVEKKKADAERTAIWYSKNKNRVAENRSNWRKLNYDKKIKKDREWFAKNPHKYAEIRARRRSRILESTPTNSWKIAIDGQYEIARRISNCLSRPNCKIIFEVDHINPLSRGGLHHQDNLQVIPRSWNRKKHDKCNFPLPYQIHCATKEVA